MKVNSFSWDLNEKIGFSFLRQKLFNFRENFTLMALLPLRSFQFVDSKVGNKHIVFPKKETCSLDRTIPTDRKASDSHLDGELKHVELKKISLLIPVCRDYEHLPALLLYRDITACNKNYDNLNENSLTKEIFQTDKLKRKNHGSSYEEV